MTTPRLLLASSQLRYIPFSDTTTTFVTLIIPNTLMLLSVRNFNLYPYLCSYANRGGKHSSSPRKGRAYLPSTI